MACGYQLQQKSQNSSLKEESAALDDDRGIGLVLSSRI